jgi:GTP-binding protein Era
MNESAHRSGFVALVGRPNAGKSTLLNRLVGQKLAIVSPRPQTTRTSITGIAQLPHAQVVFVDTPGLHHGAGKLSAYMAATAARALADVDVVCLVADASRTIDRHDEALLTRLAGCRAPVYCCLNKVDLVRPRARLLPRIAAYRARLPFKEVVPVSATEGTNCDRLLELIVGDLPERAPDFPADALTDQPETFFVAETVREKIFHFTHDEVPYACAVQVEELIDRGGGRGLSITATIFVEQASQKGIVIGKAGSMLKRIGTAARKDLERFFGVPVYLALRVDVRPKWRTNDRALREFGFRLTS